MRTGYCFDPEHRHHTMPGHHENASRLDAVEALCREDGIFDRLTRVPCEPVPPAELLAVHDRDYLSVLDATDTPGVMMLDIDTYATNASFDLARRAAGGLVYLTDGVCKGKLDNGFAVVRPPGHHALRFSAMGFCLLNTVAVAACWAMRRHKLERIAILDIDVHHGNGTQDAFYDNPAIFFADTHQYPFYPGTGEANETGRGAGEGLTLNLPLPEGTGDAGLLAAYRDVVGPRLKAFAPELIFVSAGYDTHWRDPIGGFTCSLGGTMALLQEIQSWADSLCDGRLVLTLEGGYDAEVLAHGVLSTLRRLHDPEAAISDPFGASNVPEKPIGQVLARLAGGLPMPL